MGIEYILMQKHCVSCSLAFTLMEDDLQLLDKLAPVINGKSFPLPPPTHCPSCRCQRRFGLRNERNLYRRTCALTGKPMVSLYSEDKPFVVYSESAWASDAWDPMQYGIDMDFTKTFFDQFAALMQKVPRRGMHQDGLAENSDYTAFGMNNKNCYLAFSCFLCQDVYYSSWMMGKNCMDCLCCVQGELLYECVGCNNCYHCFSCHDCSNCQDSILLDDCRNCHNCIGCKNLREKEYHIYNKPVSREEFEAKRQALFDGRFATEKIFFDRWKVTLPTLCARITQSEHCSGNYIEQARNCIDCYFVQLGAEDCRHCQMCGWKSKDMMDCSSAGKNAEILYEMHGAGSTTQRCAFDSFASTCEQVYYSENIRSCTQCFGCIGLTSKHYCILNKQYTEEEYNELVPKIIQHMEKTPLRLPDGSFAGQEWGEFFPVSMSPFAYNETLAQDHFPLTKEEVLAKGWQWKATTGDPPTVAKTIRGSDLPAIIDAVQDDVLDYAIICEVTGKPFRIIKQELDFYRREHLALPRLHPEERHRRRMALRTPYRLWTRTCQNCQREIQTSYAPERPEIVYCESCYLKSIY